MKTYFFIVTSLHYINLNHEELFCVVFVCIYLIQMLSGNFEIWRIVEGDFNKKLEI